MKQRFCGFTLIELLIAMMLLAIISSLAYPSYLNSIRKSRRVDAQQAMMEAAQRLESFYAGHARYTDDLREIGYQEKDWNRVVAGSNIAYYRIKVSNADNCNIVNCFMLEVESLGDQIKDSISGYVYWSSGRKQRMLDGNLIEGWR